MYSKTLRRHVQDIKSANSYYVGVTLHPLFGPLASNRKRFIKEELMRDRQVQERGWASSFVLSYNSRSHYQIPIINDLLPGINL